VQQITDGGMKFDLIRVKQVRRGSPGDRAGFRKGDQIIAAPEVGPKDGMVRT
jgi:predicted metalloprotease with PDZ domain